MARARLRIPSVLLLSAAAAWFAWRHLPSSVADRALIRVVAGSTANPPFVISGNGTHASPWAVRVSAPTRAADPALVPSVVSMGDDPEGIFQSSPPSPVDVGIILKNMRRLGVSRAGVAATLAWEKPDVFGLSVLDSELAAFGKIATSAPLSRGPTSTALPPSFRRASVAPDHVTGGASDLPTVNRIPLPGVILGGDNALSGFSVLENEPEGIPLVAKWDDRIVFAFPVIAVMVRHNLPIDGIQVSPGSHLKLGADGPFVPIDRYGRLAISPENKNDGKVHSAASLLDATEPIAGKNQESFALLRDDQSGAETAVRRFSASLVPQVAAISSGAGMSAPQVFRRFPVPVELTLLGAVCLVLAAVALRTRFVRELTYGIAAGTALALHLILAATASLWPMTLAVLAAALAAFIVDRLFFRDPLHAVEPVRETAPEPEPSITELPIAPEPVVVEPSPASEPEPAPGLEPEPVVPEKAPAKKAAKKAAAKKTAAKKSPARKVAKKGSAKKSSKGKKSPPPGGQ